MLGKAPKELSRRDRHIDNAFESTEGIFRFCDPHHFDEYGDLKVESFVTPKTSVNRKKYCTDDLVRWRIGKDNDVFLDITTRLAWTTVGEIQNFEYIQEVLDKNSTRTFEWTLQLFHVPYHNYYHHSQIHAFKDGIELSPHNSRVKQAIKVHLVDIFEPEE